MKPRPSELWKEVEAAGGTAEEMAERYRALLIEHGHLIIDPKCNECSQTARKRIHNDPTADGAHEFKPLLTSEDPLLHVAYLKMEPEEARAHWEMSRGNTASFEALVRHAVSHEFRVLGGDQARADYAAGRKGGYPFEITDKRTGEKTTGIACISYHPGERRPRCEWCRSRAGTDECDFVVGETCPACKGSKHKGLKPCPKCAGRGVQLCNRRFCAKQRDGRCGVHVSNEEGYCPEHMEAAGHRPQTSPASNRVDSNRVRNILPAGKPPRPKLEDCRWAESQIEGTCLHKGCPRVVRVGERCLYFPSRRRAMCAGCGAEYLKVAK